MANDHLSIRQASTQAINILTMADLLTSEAHRTKEIWNNNKTYHRCAIIGKSLHILKPGSAAATDRVQPPPLAGLLRHSTDTSGTLTTLCVELCGIKLASVE